MLRKCTWTRRRAAVPVLRKRTWCYQPHSTPTPPYSSRLIRRQKQHKWHKTGISKFDTPSQSAISTACQKQLKIARRDHSAPVLCEKLRQDLKIGSLPSICPDSFTWSFPPAVATAGFGRRRGKTSVPGCPGRMTSLERRGQSQPMAVWPSRNGNNSLLHTLAQTHAEESGFSETSYQ